MRRLCRHAAEMIFREWLVLEFRGAVEAYDRTYDDIADLELFADAARRSGRDHQFRLHFLDDLTPHIDIRQLRTVLRHMRVRFEDHDRLVADVSRPISAEAFGDGCRAA